MNAWRPRDRMQWVAAGVGLLGLATCLLCGFFRLRQTLLSYLFAFLFFTGLGVGSLALLMVHALTGGAWGFRIRPALLAAARTLPLQGSLILPILFGLHVLYPWAQPDAMAHDPVLRLQSWYLNPVFFVIRSVICVLLWLVLLFVFTRSIENNASHDASRSSRIAAPGLIVFAITSLLAATDWVMSLVPHWHSSTFGMMVATGWMLGSTALAIVLATLGCAGRNAPIDQLHDLGNLLLMFVLAWSYLAFMQYLTIWIADLPTETVWYIPRTLTSWRIVAWLLIAFHFIVPFCVLLSRRAKRCRQWLGAIAGMVLIANLIDAFWLVVPSSRPSGLSLRWSDVLAPLGMGGLWTYVYLAYLRVGVRPTRQLGNSSGTPKATLSGQTG